MSVKVKICGLKTPRTVDAAIKGGANFIGFIFFDKSPRYINPEDAAKLTPLIPQDVNIVSVTVNADDVLLDRIVNQLSPAILQLHGKESLERVEEIKMRYNLPVMKAFSISKAADITDAMRYRSIADFFLFDAKAPEGSLLPGGNGVSFDWSLLKMLDDDMKYMLSGGLNESNIATALNNTNTSAIDISSGVENAHGIKDPKKIKAFFYALEKALKKRTPF